jgi:predicted nucleic acid-binding protein
MIVYLIDTNVISELRKKTRANRGVISFFQKIIDSKQEIYLSVISIGELRRGVELIRHRGDIEQAKLLENWLERLLSDYSEKILELDTVSAQLWGRLRVPNPENSIDKQIAAIALVHDLIVVTRNITDFDSTGVATFNPFIG